jgi:hypothetical protein
MRNLFLLLALPAALLLTGCGPMMSVHPLYTDQDLANDLPLAGRWTDEEGEAIAVVKAEENGYRVLWFADDSGSGEVERFDVHLVRVGDSRFLDVMLQQQNAFTIPGHLFVKVWFEGDVLCLGMLKEDWLSSQPDFPAHTKVGSQPSRIVLTTATPDLQAWIKRYAHEARAFDDDVARLHRVR